MLEERYARVHFEVSAADGERLASALTGVVNDRLAAASSRRAELGSVVADLAVRGHALRRLETGYVVETWRDAPAALPLPARPPGGKRPGPRRATHHLALFVHGDFDGDTQSELIDRVEVVWALTDAPRPGPRRARDRSRR